MRKIPMSEQKRKAPAATVAKHGKVSGKAEVKPAATEEAADVQGAPKAAEEAAVSDQELTVARQAGYTASQRGTPSRPPLGYTEGEAKAWYAGYKEHANPNARASVNDVAKGYRGDY
jgi:hypothetical protein